MLKRNWAVAWLIQTAEMLAVCLVQALCFGIAPLDDILLWGAVPLAALFTAFQAVRRGLNNYVAWLAPPVCLFAAHYFIWRYSPSAGAAMLAAFTAIVGAAAGDVYVRGDYKKRR